MRKNLKTSNRRDGHSYKMVPYSKLSYHLLEYSTNFTEGAHLEPLHRLYAPVTEGRLKKTNVKDAKHKKVFFGT